MAYKYMHLIDGEPAHYVTNQQILCVDLTKTTVRLAHSLAQIRREQRASDRWRKAQGLRIDDVYSYARFSTE